MAEDEQLEKITIARDYTSLEGALQEMLDILSGKYDKYEEEEIPMTEHELLEKITDIVRDYTDSEEAIKEIDEIIFGQYEEEK